MGRSCQLQIMQEFLNSPNSHYGAQLYGSNVKYKNQMDDFQKAISQQGASTERVPASPNMSPVGKEAESPLKSKHSVTQSLLHMRLDKSSGNK